MSVHQKERQRKEINQTHKTKGGFGTLTTQNEREKEKSKGKKTHKTTLGSTPVAENTSSSTYAENPTRETDKQKEPQRNFFEETVRNREIAWTERHIGYNTAATRGKQTHEP